MIGKRDHKNGRRILDDALELARDISYDLGVKMVNEVIKDSTPRKMSSQAATPGPVQLAKSLGPETPAAKTPTATVAFVGPDPELVKSRILSLVVDMTGTSHTVDVDTPFMDSGIDSLAATEMRTSLQQQFGVSLPSTVMFNFPTTSAMTNYLVDEMTDKKIALT